jgi:hypothetical protein
VKTTLPVTSDYTPALAMPHGFYTLLLALVMPHGFYTLLPALAMPHGFYTLLPALSLNTFVCFL